GIRGVQGDRVRRVELSESQRKQRGGVLTHASMLTATSHPDRTSPVKRGLWIVEEILGLPQPPPPPEVPELKIEKQGDRSASIRKLLENHRADAGCAVCHQQIDPPGFALENYDAIGAWRDLDGKHPIDASGVLPNGQSFKGPDEFRAILKNRPEDFTRCITEKMLIYALGRGLVRSDRDLVSELSRALAADKYKFSALVLGIVQSDPFQKRQRYQGARK
ncbi:MAG: DUF1588 domain-containing protein, partial [Acidobacteria bacterium]|nr:DUF1588 domain-containing protein [Acidobacteriota bacterium]